MTWTLASNGREAMEVALSGMEDGHITRGKLRLGCPGFVTWERFLRRNPNATLGDVLDELERLMGQGGHFSWPIVIIEHIGNDADEAARARMISVANADAANLIISGARFKATEAEIEALRGRTNGAVARPGKKAPPEARQPGRRA